MGVRRYDVGRLDAPRELAGGRLRVDGRPTRAGIFIYRQPDGTILRELRPPDEVFRPDSVASLAAVPLTDDHPADMVGTSPGALVRGAVGEDVRRDGDHLRASITVWDADLIAKMKAGKKQLSCGYTAVLDMTPGVWKGEKYDAVQRDITYDHLAVVDVGRAGPSASARVDASDAFWIGDVVVRTDAPAQDQYPSKESLMKIKIDGVEVEVSDLAAQLIEKERAASAAKLDAAEKEKNSFMAKLKAKEEEEEEEDEKAKKDAASVATAAQAKLDEQVEKVAKLEKELKDARDPARFDAAVAERVELVRVATTHLDMDAEQAAKATAHEIKLAAVEKVRGSKLDEAKAKDELYVSHRYDGALEQLEAGTPHLDAVRVGVEGARKDAAETDDEDAAAAKRRKDLNDEYEATRLGKK